MLKRFMTLILLSTLLLASTPSTLTIKASPPDGQQSSDAQAKAKVERTLREAGKSAIYDQAGRVTELTLAVSDNKNVSFSFIYDEGGRLQYLVQDDGTRIRLQYDSAGQWRGFTFPDGGRMTFERDGAGNVTGSHTEKPARHKTSQLKDIGAHRARLRRASVAFVDDCKAAVDRATDAAIAAGIACLPGLVPSVQPRLHGRPSRAT
jgi:YD repeat-containing protein